MKNLKHISSWYLLLVSIFHLLTSAFAYFDIDVQRHEQLSPTTFVDFSQLKIRKENKTRKIFGNIIFHVDMNSSVSAQVNFFKKQGGEYRLTPFRTPPDSYCNFLKTDDRFYPALAEASDFPKEGTCPLPAGTYGLRSYAPSVKNVSPLVLTTGDYMAEMNLGIGKVEYLKWRIYAIIIRI